MLIHYYSNSFPCILIGVHGKKGGGGGGGKILS